MSNAGCVAGDADDAAEERVTVGDWVFHRPREGAVGHGRVYATDAETVTYWPLEDEWDTRVPREECELITPMEFPRLPDGLSEDASRERAYKRVLRIVELNTGGESLPAGAPKTLVVRLGTQIGLGRDRSTRLLKHAVAQHDLFAFDGRSGRRRYCRVGEEPLRELVEAVAAWGEPDRELIGRANRALQEVRDE
jgi:hypothetical protein